MREPAPDYSSRQYERPNRPWVCGLAAEGQACPAGPSARGDCPALAECVPAREGDRWQCNRSALRGGVCDEGPTPEGGCGRVNRCHPVRSLRAIRGRFVSACALLAVGGMLILLSADWRDAAISPGPLARQHAQILNEPSPDPSLQGRGSCAACHAAAERGPLGWAASLAVGHGERADQSQRCMECHETSISAKFALTAHSLPPEALRQITQSKLSQAIGEPPGLSRRDKPAGSPSLEELACAACHREHQGAEFDLTAMNDAACQSCHRQQYESFAADHPDFGAWPYERRTRIAFDHASHQAKHFAEKQQPFDCRSCHLDDATGQVQLLASYEAACAACHDEKIATSVAQGVPMLALPTLDIEALRAAGHEVGGWPAAAGGDFDGPLPPAMKLLLAADPAATQAIAALGPDFEFIDIDPDDPQHLAASASLARAIREVVVELARRGPVAMRERLGAALGRDMTDAEVRQLMAGLPPELVRNGSRRWFPGVDGGAQGAAAVGLGGLDPPYGFGSTQGLAFAPAGVWSRDDERLSLSYRPTAHADPVLAGWLEVLAATPDLVRQPLARAMFEELAKPTAAGLCTSCHSVEQKHSGQFTINWRAYDRTREPRGFTRFSHGPHLVLPQLADCTTCHAIDGTKDVSTSYASWNPSAFVSEFAPMSKQQCATCHTAKLAGDACQKCHNYHVEAIEDWRLP